MRDGFQDALAALEALEEPRVSDKGTDKTDKTIKTQHNTAAALREAYTGWEPVGPGRREEKGYTPESPTDKTDKTPRESAPTPKRPTDKTDKTTEAERLGLIATWSSEFGYVSLHDPTTGEWHDHRTKDAPGWALGEARRRKELYREGNRRAYRLTSTEMGEIWHREHLAEEKGIVEDHPVEEDT